MYHQSITPPSQTWSWSSSTRAVQISNIKIDTSAPYLKHMLATSFAKALSQLPAEKAPLQSAWDDRVALHAKAKEQLPRLFPNMQADANAANETHMPEAAVPDATEPEPAPEIGDTDDFEGVESDKAEPQLMEDQEQFFQYLKSKYFN